MDRSEESLAGVGRPDQPSEDVGHYSDSPAGAKHALNGSSRPRPAFSFRRDLEFVRAPELGKRLGCDTHLWSRAIIKELIDNALDAVEEAGAVLPRISICINGSSIEVADNGPGMSAELVARLCDRSLRTSAREAYPTPERGRQGNALQVLMCLALGLGWERVEHAITSQGIQHTVVLTVDRLAQQITLERQETPVECHPGTTVRIGYPLDLVQFGYLYQLHNLILYFAALNPHAEFNLCDRTEFCDDDGDPIIGDLEIEPSAEGLEKWPSAAPIPPHWYGLERFGHRILLELIRDPEITVAQFLGSFKGLSSTQRRSTVAAAAGLSGAKLSALLDGRSIDTGRAGRRLGKMQGASNPPKPSVLGGVGKNCVEALASSYGVRNCGADFTYLVVEGGEQTPWRWEIAFAELESASARVLYLGHNFSPLVAEDVFLRSLILPHQLIGSDAPVFLFLHRIAVDPDSLDYGKSHVVIRPEEYLALRKAIDKAAKRYLDRLEREEADRIRELDRVERRKAEVERNHRDAEKSASFLPWRPPGRQTPELQGRYDAALRAFCALILEINDQSSIRVSSRGWCYLIEEHGLRKGDFDTAQALINDCRKSGLLPLDICVEDGKRVAENLEDVDHEWSADDRAESIVGSLAAEHLYWTPLSFWEDQPAYVECLVEKIDLPAPACGSRLRS